MGDPIEGGRRRIVFVLLALALWAASAASPARAQRAGPPPAAAVQPADTTDETSGASASDPAVSRDRPANEHPFDGWDAVALPFRVATFPVDLLGDGIHLLLDATMGPSVAPPPPVRLYRRVTRWGLRPEVGSLGPRSGPAAELVLDRLEPFRLRTAFSWREYQTHEAGLRWSGSRGGVEIVGGFDRDAELHFWGVGADSRRADEASYLRDRVYGGVEGTLRPPGPVEVGVGLGYEENRLDRGFDGTVPAVIDRFTPESLYGLGSKTRFFRASLAADLDRVAMDGLSKRGFGLSLRSSVYVGAGPTRADFHRVRGTGRAFLPLSGRHLVALRAAAEVNRSDAGRGVPFSHLAEMGGEAGGRAYSDQRFRDLDALELTAEWRWEVWRELLDRMRLEGFVFADEGAVARRLDDLSSSSLRASFGGGFRLVSPGGEVAQLYWATGEEGSRVEVDVGTSF